MPKKKKNNNVENVVTLEINDKIKKDTPANRITKIDKPGTIIARLETVNEELSGVADEFSMNLMNILKNNEELTRETYLTQVEIKRASSFQETLKKNIEEHTAELGSIGALNVALEKEAEKTHKQFEKIRDERDAVSKEKEDLEKEISILKKESDRLTIENGKLKTRKEKFANEVASLKKIREEYLSQIAKFKELKDELLA